MTNNEINNESYNDLIKNNNSGIFIISKDNCPLCEQLKQLFETIEVEFVYYLYVETDNEINNDYPFKSEMKEKTRGKLFPFCYFNGEYVGGYKQIHQNLITGKLKEQLNKMGIDYEEDF
jgi:glutaredoxin-related protein